jgi:hypothetical protein
MPHVHPLFRPQGFQVEASPGTYCWLRPDAAFRLGPAEYPAADWLGKDYKGRLVVARAGALCRVTKKEEFSVRDFNHDAPEPRSVSDR